MDQVKLAQLRVTPSAIFNTNPLNHFENETYGVQVFQFRAHFEHCGLWDIEIGHAGQSSHI
jgi:hypothetical protein